MNPTVRVITLNEFKNNFVSLQGSLLFQNNDLYDCKAYVDIKALRTKIKSHLSKGTQLMKVLIYTENSPDYLNIANNEVPYKYPVASNKNQDGAYFKNYEGMSFGMFVCDYPAGNVIVVINK